MQLRNIHEKLIEAIQIMLIDTKVNLPYYGNFNLFVNFQQNDKMPTCAVNISSKGFNFFYNSEFLAGLSQKEVNFVTLHEDFHLLWSHPKRTITGQYDPKLANIAQDMIINHVIVEDIPDWFIEIPKDKEGKNMALFVPKEYQGKLIFEELYEWLRDKQEEHSKAKKSSGGKDGKDGEGKGGDGKDNQDGEGKGKGKYGPNGKNPKAGRNGEPDTIDTYSLDDLFDNIDDTQGQYMDQHMGDEVPEETREAMVKEAMDRLQARGFAGGNVEQTLNKLRKRRKDYLSHIKRHVSNLIFGTKKMKTIVKPNRRQIAGVKGNRKVKTKINVILDTSGSMGGQGTFERVLSFVYRNDIEVNMIQGDTEVKWFENFKSKRKLETMKIHGLGGTILQPSIDFVEQHYNEFNTVVLSDGYTDNLDISKLRGNVLMISVGVKMPIARSNGKLKQIVLEPTE